MKKLFAFILASVLTLSTCMVVLAAPPTEAPSEMSVEEDGKTHSVYVFGTALALMFSDGGIEISSMGPVGRVDVMMDGVVIKNVSSVNVPAEQKTKMALEADSIIIKNATKESGEIVKKQIEDAYASGVDSIDLSSLDNVTAYKVNEDGDIENANGEAVSANALEVSIASVDTTVESFGETMAEIIAEDKAKEAAEQQKRAASNPPAKKSGSTPSSAPSTTPGTKPDPAPTDSPEQGGEQPTNPAS